MPGAKGKIIIITAPSGSGKTTLIRRLMDAVPDLGFSISACTRNPRNGEQHSKDYYFYSIDEFKKLIEEDALVEWEMVYEGKYYGTKKAELQRIWDEGHTPLVDIDVQGALAIKSKYPTDSLSIFIEAPSLTALRERLVARGTETSQSLKERLDKAEYEMAFASRFDKILVNDDLEVASKELIDMVTVFIK